MTVALYKVDNFMVYLKKTYKIASVSVLFILLSCGFQTVSIWLDEIFLRNVFGCLGVIASLISIVLLAVASVGFKNYFDRLKRSITERLNVLATDGFNVIQSKQGSISLPEIDSSFIENDLRLRKDTEERLKVQQELVSLIDKTGEKYRTRSEFVANMSHELRTPLNSIIGFTDLIHQDVEDKDYSAVADDIKKVHAAGLHLLELVNAILDISKLDSGKMELQYDTVEVGKLTQIVADIVGHQIEKNGNQFFYECPLAIGKTNTDPGKLRQILLNVLGNAAKFTRNGTVRFCVAPIKFKGVDSIEYTIADTGIGMEETQLARIFDRFVQLDNQLGVTIPGSGLGLSICRDLCHAFSGDIFVDSQPGVGTTFRIVLPRLQNHASQDSLGNRKILLVDDDSDARELWRDYLTAQGYQVFVAESGEVALLVFRDTQPDVVVTDLIMPGMMGHDLVKSVREGGSDCAIVATTGKLMGSKIDEDLQNAVSRILIKPFDPEELIECLEEILEGQHSSHSR